MAETIDYDKPITDYIPELSATGHVTHQSFTKKSVTMHHNGGVLSMAGVLSTWKTRAASAHFDVDLNGNIAQFVKVTEYAWATGSTQGNEESISIEMSNSANGGDWPVSDATLASATRLAGWLFANVIKARPSTDNFFPHKHWFNTDCPGPYVSGKFASLLSDVIAAYESFAGGTKTAPPSSGKETIAQVAAEVIAGKWGNNPERATKLSAAGYNPTAVQDEVNSILSGNSGSAPEQKSVQELAKEVIAGQWGSGPDRVHRLTNAGYNAAAVQAEVNKQLS